jgi:hypothetical protein
MDMWRIVAKDGFAGDSEGTNGLYTITQALLEALGSLYLQEEAHDLLPQH